MAPRPLLRIENLSVFHGQFQAIRDLNLDVEAGEIVSIIGANGAGKSSLLKAIVGQVDRVVGAIRLDGNDLVGQSTAAIVGAGVSMAPEGRRLFPSLTVEENLNLGWEVGRRGEIGFDEVYGYHNFPGGPFGIFATRPGAMMAAADIFEITLRGAGGHGAMPNTTRDPIPAAAQLVLALQTLVSRETDPILSAVVSVTNLNAGSGAFNVIPESAKLSGTVRTFDAKLRDHIEQRIGAMAESIAATFRLTSEYTYGRITEPVINDPESTTHCRAAAAAIVGPDHVVDMPPIMGGEDFGGFLEVRPGAFMGIGQGEKDPASPHNQGLHTPHSDFNDAIIPLAAGYFAELAERRLPID